MYKIREIFFAVLLILVSISIMIISNKGVNDARLKDEYIGMCLLNIIYAFGSISNLFPQASQFKIPLNPIFLSISALTI